MRQTRLVVLVTCFGIALDLTAQTSLAFAAPPATVFVAVAPCRIADTRVAGGPIAGNTNRVFKVVGVGTDFTSQGGSASGCGIPDFSGVVPQVQAIALNVVAANHAGAGFLTAFAGDTSRPLASTLNFTAGTTIANGVIVPVRQTAPGGNDLKVFVNLASDVFMDVTGYFTDLTLVDGSGSGIDADTVDGLHASDFGDITDVTAGAGLTGGATSGNATVNLDLAASNTWTGNTTFDPSAGLAFSTGSGDEIDLGGSVKKGGTLFLHNIGNRNLGVGLKALASNPSGGFNTASGYSALRSNTSGFSNTASGAYALAADTTGYGSAAIGAFALQSNTTGQRNTAGGSFALQANTTGSNNTSSGVDSLTLNSTGSRNTALGNRAGYNLTTGDDNIDIGNEGVAAEGATIRIGTAGTQTKTFVAGIRGVTTGIADQIPVCIDSAGQLGTASCGAAGDITGVTAGTGLSGGATSGNATLSLNLAASNTWTGSTTFNPVSGFAFTTGIGDDIDLGGNVTKSGTLFLHNNGTNNLGVGLNALASNTGGGNTASGYYALKANTTGGGNTASGFKALFSNTTGYLNTASGDRALLFNTTGFDNTASGSSALQSNTTGSDNAALGYGALFYNTTGLRNTASGDSALHDNTTGSYNTASGAFALSNNTAGFRNTAVGYQAGLNLTTGSDNIDIGARNYGVAGESATIRIGTSGTQTQAFVAGIAGATVSNSSGVLIDVFTGQLGTIVSSRRYKEGIRDMADLSERILKLRPVAFRYKKEVEKGERSLEYGLIAEEVAEVFPELVVYGRDGQPETVKYHVLAPLLLNELQKQKIQVEERERHLEAQLLEERSAREGLQARLAEQRHQLADEFVAQREEFADRLTALLERLATLENRGAPGDMKPVQSAARRLSTERR